MSHMYIPAVNEENGRNEHATCICDEPLLHVTCELVEAASDRSHLVLRMAEMPLASHGSGVAAQTTEQRRQRGNIRWQAYSDAGSHS